MARSTFGSDYRHKRNLECRQQCPAHRQPRPARRSLARRIARPASRRGESHASSAAGRAADSGLGRRPLRFPQKMAYSEIRADPRHQRKLVVDRQCHKGGRPGSSASLLPGWITGQARGVRNRTFPPPLNEQKILTWARGHLKATGRWPSHQSGPIAKSPGETWCAVDQALRKGRRGLRGGSSLARLLRKHGLK